MAETQKRTVSIVGVSLFSAIVSALIVWLGPFVVPDLMPSRPAMGWSSGQYHGFAVAVGVGVGFCTATVLVLVRRFLPDPVRSRIVWFPPDLLDRAKMRKQAVEFAIVVAFMVGIMLWVYYGPPRFWGRFGGMSEAEVRQQLGEPFDDSRRHGDGGAAEYRLGWQQGFATSLYLTFDEDGTVIAQKRAHR